MKKISSIFRMLCRNCDLRVNELPVEEHGEFLRNMNIDEVSVLVVNDKAEKRILIGEVGIKKYLLNVNYNKEKSARMPEIFSSSAYAGTCKVGELCEN